MLESVLNLVGFRAGLARVWLAAAVCCAAAAPAIGGPVSAAPTPDWVEPVAVELAPVAPTNGLELLLRDAQISVSAQGVVRYRHGARRPVSAAGLGGASAIQISFDPEYQTYAWHMLAIRRGDAVLDALAQAEIEQATGDGEGADMLRRKTRVTAFVRDVRVGDVIEYAYSVAGEQPALGGRFADVLELADDQAIGVIQHRVLWPAERTLNVRAHGTKLEPERTREGDREVYVWKVRAAEPVAVEANTPTSFDSTPWVQLSEFASWSDVVDWALPMYRSEALVTPELERLAASFRDSGSRAEAAERATRFVQDEVRYLAFEFGEGSLRPREPDLVAARRFGDCKDKSLLLITLLRLLDVEAVPVLVSTYDRAAVQERLPSPYDFNHVIVRAELEGRPIWIDSTASYERGPLAERPSPPYAVALPIAPGVTAPETIVDARTASEPEMHLHEVFELSDTGGAALLSVTTVYRGAQANQRRAELATQDRAALQQGYLKFYTGLYGRTRVAKPLQVSDDEARNEIEIDESYALDELWDGGTTLQLWSIGQHVVRPEDDVERRAPLALQHPAHVLHEIDLLLPVDAEATDEDTEVGGPGVESRFQASYSARHLYLRKEFRTVAAQVAVDELALYRSALERIDASSAYWVRAGRGGRLGGREAFVPALVLLALGAFLGLSSVRSWRARTRKQRFARTLEVDDGERPERALAAISLEALEEHMSQLSCSCASRPLLQIERAPSRLLYMDREVWQQSARCASCGARVSRYFIVGAGGAGALGT